MSPFKPVTVTAPRWLLVALVLAAAAMPVAASLVSGRVDSNTSSVAASCEGLHKLVAVLDKMIAAGRPQIEQYGREGTLSPAQVARALIEQAKNRALLATADCE